MRGRATQIADDPLPHFRRRFPGKRDRENVDGIDAANEEIEVTRHEDGCLAGTGRGLEDDVMLGVLSVNPRFAVVPHAVRLDHDSLGVVGPEQRELITHRRRNPSGTLSNTRTTCT